MSRRLRAECPGKINLRLRVLGRRDDGYHELETVFQAIDVWDTLLGDPADALTLRCDAPDVPADVTNLVLRAAESLRQASGRPRLGGALTLRKRLPAGGGLGGGSSDAAGALVLLRALWDLETTDRQLHDLAAGLGSDVPFFLVGGTAVGRGRGERLAPLPFGGPRPLVLGFPPFSIATEEVYEGLGASRLTPDSKNDSFGHLFLHKSQGGKDFGFAVNDLEAVVFEKRPELRGFRDELLKLGAGAALLSGSGSTGFGAFDREDQVQEARDRLQKRFARWTVVASRTIGEGVRLVRG